MVAVAAFADRLNGAPSAESVAVVQGLHCGCCTFVNEGYKSPKVQRPIREWKRRKERRKEGMDEEEGGGGGGRAVLREETKS